MDEDDGRGLFEKQFVLALVEDEEDVAKIDAAYYLKE